MAEDPDLSRQRIEQQQLRRQLNEVFGPFEQFCEYVAGTNSAGSSGIMRHGVVQIPTTPILSSRSMLPSSAPAPSPNTHQSTQQLLQSMQNLVTSPIQPLQGMPFSCNRDYLNTAPSSSTHNNSESRDSAKKGKRYRTMDSDSEVEREKRRRGREDSRSSGLPGNSGNNRTHQSSSNPDGLRALFGGSSDRKEPPDKGISPDSGIHSAENDPGDENDVHSAQTIINLITRLSPPLSPIKQRPIDKKAERERREAEQRERERRREREEAERLERERLERLERERKEKEEREQQEKEQAERERVRRENERMEYERRERERKEKEREEKERKEKEQQEREREERREREREERKREREREEKLRKEKEEEKLRREMRKQKEKERSSEKKPKEMNDRTEEGLERKERTKNADVEKSESLPNERKDSTARMDGLKGEITLRGLDRSKLKQLVEIGRRAGRLKEDYKEDGKEASAKEEKRKEKKEKEKEREKKSKDRLSVEDALRKSAKLPSAKSSPCLPRAGSSQSHEDASHSRPSSAISNHPPRSGFECAAHECVPLRPARPVKPEEGSTELLYDFYHSIAKSRKRKGDAEADKVARVLLYLDAAAYFILSAKHFNPPDGNENRANRQYSIIRDTGDLLKKTTNMFLAQTDSSPPLHAHLSSRIRNLSLRCQACLMYHLYNLRSSNALKTYSMLAQMEAQLQEEQAQNGSSAQNTSSPGSSVHSNSNQSATVVTMPTRVYEVQRQQLKTLHQLMFAHRAWQDAVKRADVSTTDMGFIGGLEKICGATFLDAPLEKMSAFVLTGIAWLRAEYEREKLRPPPPVVKRNAAPS